MSVGQSNDFFANTYPHPLADSVATSFPKLSASPVPLPNTSFCAGGIAPVHSPPVDNPSMAPPSLNQPTSFPPIANGQPTASRSPQQSADNSANPQAGYPSYPQMLMQGSVQQYPPSASQQESAQYQQPQQQQPLMPSQPVSNAPMVPHYPTEINSAQPALCAVQPPTQPTPSQYLTSQTALNPDFSQQQPNYQQQQQTYQQPMPTAQPMAFYQPGVSAASPYQLSPQLASQVSPATVAQQATQPAVGTSQALVMPNTAAQQQPASAPMSQPYAAVGQPSAQPYYQQTVAAQYQPAPPQYPALDSVQPPPPSSLPQQTPGYPLGVNSASQAFQHPLQMSQTGSTPKSTQQCLGAVGQLSSKQQAVGVNTTSGYYHNQNHRAPPKPQQSQGPAQRAPAAAGQSIYDQQKQMQGDLSRQQSSVADRIQGIALTGAEWNLLNCPLSLLHDSNLLPSDGPELPPRPAIMNEVNCHPDYMRCSLTAVPVSSKLQSKCRLPLGLLVHPFRDVNDLPVIQTSAIVRCRSCRTYINPFVRFLDNGRRWSCPVCSLTNNVPEEFYYDPSTRTYGDPSRRPEIRSATVEFVAPSEYMLRPPQAATYVYCLEVSRNAVATGYLELVCNMLADQLTKMPGDARRQIALMTYDSGVHFYLLSGKSMRMVICQDLSEVFLPDCDGLVNRINDNVEPITNLLRQLPKEFAHTQDTSNCLGFVLQSALKMIGGTGGRVAIFNTSLPNKGPGALEVRETREDLSKPDPEHLRPSNDFYRTLALDFAAVQIAVDLFVLNSKYCDIATISGVSRFSGGAVYHYPNFHYTAETPTTSGDQDENSEQQEAATPVAPAASQQRRGAASSDVRPPGAGPCDFVEVESLRRDLLRYLTRKIGFEAVLRVRCTRGLAIQNFYGNFFVRSVDLLSLPNVNPDAGYGMQLEINEKLDSCSTVVFQAALLYTSAYGDRRIRVHTLCLPVTDSAEAVFNYADEGAVACLVSKMAVEKTINSGLPNAREALTTVVGDILDAYQRERKSGTSRNSLSGLCPASLRLLPSYLCGALRSPAFRNHLPTSLDIRSGALELIVGAPAHRVLPLIYPRLYSVGSLLTAPVCGADATLALKAATLSLEDSSSTMGCLQLSGKSITREGVFLLDTGNVVILLVGYGLSVEEMRSLTGYERIDDLAVEKAVTKLGPLEADSPPKKRILAMIKSIRRDRCLGTALAVIRHDVPEPLKGRFINALVEDKTASAPSYSEFVQMVLNGRS